MITFVAEEPRQAGVSDSKQLLSRVVVGLRLREMPLFYLMVVLPTLVSAIYLLLIASPIYVSQASFFVRSANAAQATGLNFVLQGVGLGQAETDSFAVHDYIMSRDAIADLDQHHNLRGVLSRPAVPARAGGGSFQGLSALRQCELRWDDRHYVFKS